MQPNKTFGSSSRRKNNKSKVYVKSTKDKDKQSNIKDLKMKNIPEKRAIRLNR